jgi:hypothetical protein
MTARIIGRGIRLVRHLTFGRAFVVRRDIIRADAFAGMTLASGAAEGQQISIKFRVSAAKGPLHRRQSCFARILPGCGFVEVLGICPST